MEPIVLALGWIGIFSGSAAFYLAAAEVLNETYGRTILPVGPVPMPGHPEFDEMPSVPTAG